VTPPPGAPTTAPEEASALRRPRWHLVGAHVLGVLAFVLGGPVVVGALFGGTVAALLALAGVVSVTALVAWALDRAQGPPARDAVSPVLRGATVAVLGCGAVLAGAWFDVRVHVHDLVPLPMLALLTGLPFTAVAALQWPGSPRRIAGGLLAVTVLAVAVPMAPDAWENGQERRDREAMEAVGTLQRPWVTDAADLRFDGIYTVGNESLIIRYLPADGPSDAQVHIRVQRFLPDLADCSGGLVSLTSENTPLVDCRSVEAGTWLRASETSHEVLRDVDGTTVAVGGPREVPEAVLRAALDAARPLDDEEYDAWLDREASD
jgi:hypothetical protein